MFCLFQELIYLFMEMLQVPILIHLILIHHKCFYKSIFSRNNQKDVSCGGLTRFAFHSRSSVLSNRVSHRQLLNKRPSDDSIVTRRNFRCFLPVHRINCRRNRQSRHRLRLLGPPPPAPRLRRRKKELQDSSVERKRQSGLDCFYVNFYYFVASS